VIRVSFLTLMAQFGATKLPSVVVSGNKCALVGPEGNGEISGDTNRGSPLKPACGRPMNRAKHRHRLRRRFQRFVLIGTRSVHRTAEASRRMCVRHKSIAECYLRQILLTRTEAHGSILLNAHPRILNMSVLLNAHFGPGRPLGGSTWRLEGGSTTRRRSFGR
jgi:hypothetical protein